MRIERIELRVLTLPLVRHFETSFGRVHDRRFLLTRLDGGGVSGLGECVADDHPFYSAETVDTAWHVIERFLAPMILGVDFAHPRDVFPAMSRVRGHNMAKAALEMAGWDLYARQLNLPLYRVFGGERTSIPAGVSIGIQDSLGELADRVASELAEGYRRVKIKVKPGWDVEAVEMIRARLGDVPLMVDANAAYTLDDAAHLKRLDPFNLMMIEQPLDYEDIADHAALQRELRTPVCLDESIHSVRSARDAIAADACRIINIKPGRVGGHAESIRLHDLCAEHGIPVWHGGMLESGIGRAHNLHLSSLPNFSLPGDVAASRRYFQPDLIEPGIDVRSDGTMPIPVDGPGIGVAVEPARIEAATSRRVELRAS